MTINNVVKALCKRTQHRWTTTPNIVSRLHTLLHIVACCYVSLGVIARSLKPVKILATCKPTQQFPTSLAHHCSELLGPFARS